VKKLLLAVLAISVLAPLSFYGWHDWKAKKLTETHALPYGCSNAIKHASAAALVYTVLHTLGLGHARTSAMVEELGILNEWAETYVKRGKPDTTGEMKKDLFNNLVGIELARQLAANAALSKDWSLALLCKEAVLITDAQARFGLVSEKCRV